MKVIVEYATILVVTRDKSTCKHKTHSFCIDLAQGYNYFGFLLFPFPRLRKIEIPWHTKVWVTD